jgi:hypothetical protein
MGKHDGLKEIRKLDLHIKEARPFDEGVVKLNVIRRTFPRFSKSLRWLLRQQHSSCWRIEG